MREEWVLLLRRAPFYYGTKRIFDLGVAVVLLIIAAPVLLVASVAIRLRLGKPILFTQERPGLGERPFCLYKLRTMTDARDPGGRLLPDVDRLTPLGRFLRRTSVDELPQLLNVIAGNMSVVGPRPLLPEYLPFYTAAERARHSVPPGITGLAQVRGRNGLSWEERLALDAEYASNASWSLDLRILLATVSKVVMGTNVTPPPSHKGPLHKYRAGR